MKARLAVGHDAAFTAGGKLGPANARGRRAHCGSTANDLLTFLAANLGYTKTAARTSDGCNAESTPAHGAGRTRSGPRVARLHDEWQRNRVHNGGYGRLPLLMGFDRETRVGVVRYPMPKTTAGVDDIGRHLLDASFPLMAPANQHKEVTVDPKLFDGYVGTTTGAERHSDGRAGWQSPFRTIDRQPKFEIFPPRVIAYYF